MGVTIVTGDQELVYKIGQWKRGREEFHWNSIGKLIFFATC